MPAFPADRADLTQFVAFFRLARVANQNFDRVSAFHGNGAVSVFTEDQNRVNVSIGARGGQHRITIEALANFPIERDLVVDMSDFMEKLERIKPYIVPKEELDVCNGETLQTPEQLAKYRQFSMCINCGLCYAACPQYALKPEFLGPAALALLYRYNEDSRDSAKAERMKLVHQESGVWSCTFVGYCSEVCPKGVDPAAAIQLGKVESSKDYLIAMFKPGE